MGRSAEIWEPARGMGEISRAFGIHGGCSQEMKIVRVPGVPAAVGQECSHQHRMCHQQD